MRDLFRSYYRPSNEEFSKIWEECIFCFDANVLLNIYRYSPKTRERFFEIVSKLKERIWIPHQAAYEYQEDRLQVISTQEKAHQKVRDYLHSFLGTKAFEKIKNQLNEFKRHPSIDISEILGILEKSCKNAIKKVEKSLKKAESEHPDLTISDEFRETLTDLLDGKIGNPYSPTQLNNLYQEAEQRFSAKIPPGYEDSTDKKAPKKYGDFVLWKQLIDRATLQKKPLIFVTDDTKEDWWLKHEGKTIQPRRELLEEFRLATGVDLWMYPSGKFMEYAENFLTIPHQPEILEEAEAISLSNENPQEVLGSTEATSKDSMDTSDSSHIPSQETQKVISPILGLEAIKPAPRIPKQPDLATAQMKALEVTIAATARMKILEETTAAARMKILEETTAAARMKALEETTAAARMKILEETTAAARMKALEETTVAARMKALEETTAAARMKILEETTVAARMKVLGEVGMVGVSAAIATPFSILQASASAIYRLHRTNSCEHKRTTPTYAVFSSK